MVRKIVLFIIININCFIVNGQDDLSSLTQEDIELYKFTHYISGKKFSKTETIVDNLITPAKTSEDTIKLFYFWLADNIAYDTKSFVSGDIKSYTVEEIIKRKKAVCSGYSSVFKAMCDYVGIKCYLVNGYAKGYGYKQDEKFSQTDHAWNAVCINNEWKLVDPTWGAGYVGMNNGSLEFTKRLNMTYFYTTPEKFIQKHLPANPVWQLLNHIVDMKTYIKYKDIDKINKHTLKEYYNYKDSIAALEKLKDEERIIKQAENEYNFFPVNPNNLGIHYYNYAITLSEDNTQKEKLQKSLVYYNKAKSLYSKNKLPNSKILLANIKQGIEYVEFYLNKLK